MIYYIVWIIIAILAFIGLYDKKHYKSISFSIIGISTLFAGLRYYDRWSDGEMYHNIFVQHTNVPHDIELGFKLFTKICSYILLDYNLYLCLIYAIVFLLYYAGYKGYDKRYVPFCLLVFISTMLLPSGGLRQFIAGAILFYSIKYIKEKELLKFICLVAIAFTFHRTAVIFLIAYFIPYIKMTFKQILVLTIIGVFVNILGIFEKLLALTAPYWSQITALAIRINLYQYSLVDNAILSFGFFKRLLIIILVLVFYGVNKIYRDDENDHFFIYWNIYILGFFLMLFVPGIFARINVYFYTTEAFLEVLLIKNAVKNKFVFISLFIILNGLIWANTLYTFYPELLFPYKLCF